MKKHFTRLLPLTLLALAGCAQSDASSDPTANLDTTTLMGRTVQSIQEDGLELTLAQLTGAKPAPLASGEVTISERGSDQGRKNAAQFAKEAFESMGLPARILPFQASGRTGYNVEATLEGQPDGKHLWMSAHLDSVDNAGASDDASGLASVLTSARALASARPRDTIRFVFFDLEELGLLGSQNYVSTVVTQLRREKGDDAILGNIHLDMVGYDEGKNEGIVGNCGDGGAIAPALMKGASLIGSPLTLKEKCLARSDHQNFWDAGLSAALLTDGSAYDAYPWYHEDGDTIDKINFAYLRHISQTATAAAILIAYPSEEK